MEHKKVVVPHNVINTTPRAYLRSHRQEGRGVLACRPEPRDSACKPLMARRRASVRLAGAYGVARARLPAKRGFQLESQGSASAGDLEQALKRYQGYPRLGRWEVDCVPDPVSIAGGFGSGQFTLSLVVSAESYFILNARVTASNEAGNAIAALIGAFDAYQTIPEFVAVRDISLINELKALGDGLNFTIIHVPRLAAIPEVLRGMRRLLR